MNYRELSEEYLNQYKTLSLYIRELRKMLKNAEQKDNKELCRRISILYSICLELKHVGEYLEKCVRREK